ncbi:MAG: endolytic transglycosylase MltG, partial [Rikenellaceae bacterium]
MLKKYLLPFIALVILIVVAVAVVRISFFSNALHKEATIYLRTDEIESKGYEGVLNETIKPHIKYQLAFDLYADRLNLQSTIKAGYYTLREGMTVIDIVRMLKLGNQTPVTLTFNNIRTLEQLAGRVASQIESDSLQIVECLSDPDIFRRFKVSSKEAMIAYFIPNSYDVYWTITPEALITRMYAESAKFWNSERLAKAEALNLSCEEVVTLASIVYEETAQEDEMARVAGVYVNRLRIGMPLQADPTVRYALGDFTIKRILYKH